MDTSGEISQADNDMSAKMLYDRGMDLFQQGDYLGARHDFVNALKRQPNRDLEKKCNDMLKKLSMDPVEIAAGIAVLALLIFLFIYFGMRS